MPDAWNHIDALAFDSVGDPGSDGVELTRVLGLVDYVDRTVLNRAETEQAFQRLIGSGLVEETSLRFRRTAAGQGLHSACPSTMPRERASWIETWLRDRVNCEPLTSWTLPTDRFDSAVNEYHEEMRRLVARYT